MCGCEAVLMRGREGVVVVVTRRGREIHHLARNRLQCCCCGHANGDLSLGAVWTRVHLYLGNHLCKGTCGSWDRRNG